MQVAQDLLDTLAAYKETCVGMAANMIGERIIAFDNEGSCMVMLNPESASSQGSTRRRKDVYPFWESRGRRSGTKN